MQKPANSNIALVFIEDISASRRNFILRSFAFSVICAFIILEAGMIFASVFAALGMNKFCAPVWLIAFIVAALLVTAIPGYYIFRVASLQRFINFLFRRDDKLRDSALSALEFARKVVVSRKLNANTETGELALAHINRVFSTRYQASFLPSNKNLARLLRVFAVALFMPAVFYVFFPNVLYPIFTQAVEPLRTAFSGAPADEGGVSLLTNITVKYIPPVYTKRKPYEHRGGDGNIRALKGSNIEIEAALEKNFKSAGVVLPGGIKVPAKVSGNKFTVSFQIMEAGGYHCEFEKSFSKVRGKIREISIIPDETPRLKMFGPEGYPADSTEIIVRGDEKLMLSFRAEDDFGLNDVLLIYGRPGEDKVGVEIATALDRVRYSNSYIWDISEIGAIPGERIPFYFGAKDNDNISGPKLGASAVKYLKIFSLSEYESRQEKAARAVWEKAVASLADFLNFDFLPIVPTKIIQGIGELEKSSENLHKAVLSFLRESPLKNLPGEIKKADGAAEKVRTAFYGFEREISADMNYLKASFYSARLQSGAGGQAEQIKRRALTAVNRHIGTLEKNILYIEDLLDRLRIENILKRMDELEKRYDQLQNRLKELAKTGDQKLLEEILGEIQRLLAEMQKLAGQLAALQKMHDNEFVNMKALLEQKEGDWKKLSQLIKEGKLEKAQRELDSIGEMMASMKKRLSGRMMNIDSQYMDFMRDFQKAYNDLETAIREQENILKETRDLDEKLRKMDDPRIKKEVESLIERIIELAKKLHDGMTEMKMDKTKLHGANFSKESLVRISSSIVKLLAEKDFYSSLEQTTTIKSQLETAYWYYYKGYDRNIPEDFLIRLTTAKEDSAELKMLLEKLLKAPEKNIGKKEKSRFEKLAKKQQKLGKQVNKLAQQFEKLKEKAPVLGNEMPQAIRQSAGFMKEANKKLVQSSSGKALTNEQRAAGKLKGVKEELKEMSKGDGKQGGFPMPMPGGMSRGGLNSMTGDRGYHEKVKIPSPEEFKAPHEYRKELMKGMKLPAPKGYKPQVKKYFEELAQ